MNQCQKLLHRRHAFKNVTCSWQAPKNENAAFVSKCLTSTCWKWERYNITVKKKWKKGILGGYKTDDVPPLNKFGCVIGVFKEEKKKPFCAHKGQILLLLCSLQLTEMFSSGWWLCCLVMQWVTICGCNFCGFTSCLNEMKKFTQMVDLNVNTVKRTRVIYCKCNLQNLLPLSTLTQDCSE